VSFVFVFQHSFPGTLVSGTEFNLGLFLAYTGVERSVGLVGEYASSAKIHSQGS